MEMLRLWIAISLWTGNLYRCIGWVLRGRDLLAKCLCMCVCVCACARMCVCMHIYMRHVCLCTCNANQQPADLPTQRMGLTSERIVFCPVGHAQEDPSVWDIFPSFKVR
ncbi:hypothetical protein BX666DRAFT_1975975 [Dichotomocladium elegans]|nr:hypothetical protein BX666DRAFT_1975975 [Dichotomocladium elegans]